MWTLVELHIHLYANWTQGYTWTFTFIQVNYLLIMVILRNSLWALKNRRIKSLDHIPLQIIGYYYDCKKIGLSYQHARLIPQYVLLLSSATAIQKIGDCKKMIKIIERALYLLTLLAYSENRIEDATLGVLFVEWIINCYAYSSVKHVRPYGIAADHVCVSI